MADSKMKIIVADDEVRLRELICDYLNKEGYIPIEAANGAIAVNLMEKNPDVSLIIMDVMMPEMDGWEASRKIREFSDVPIIVLTARSQEFDELMSFESGVDDFVTKPFSPAVLMKRIEAVLKRSGSIAKSQDSKAGLKIDADAYTAYLDGKAIALTVKEFEILRLLSENSGHVFTRSQLLDSIWGYDYDGDIRTVDSHMARLRVKLGEYGNSHLKTIYGLGYKLEV